MPSSEADREISYIIPRPSYCSDNAPEGEFGEFSKAHRNDNNNNNGIDWTFEGDRMLNCLGGGGGSSNNEHHWHRSARERETRLLALCAQQQQGVDRPRWRQGYAAEPLFYICTAPSSSNDVCKLLCILAGEEEAPLRLSQKEACMRVAAEKSARRRKTFQIIKITRP